MRNLILKVYKGQVIWMDLEILKKYTSKNALTHLSRGLAVSPYVQDRENLPMYIQR